MESPLGGNDGQAFGFRRVRPAKRRRRQRAPNCPEKNTSIDFQMPSHCRTADSHIVEALSQDALDHFAMDIRQTIVATLEAVGEPLVVEPEQVHQRRLQVVHMNFILRDAES